MRIISPKKDYYDSGMAWGQDGSLVFLRNGNREIDEKDVYAKLHLPRIVCNGQLCAHEKPRRTTSTFLSGWTHRRDQFPTIVHDRIEHSFQISRVVLCGVMHHGLHVRATSAAGLVRDFGDRWIWSREALVAYATEHGLSIIEGEDTMAKSWSHNWGGDSMTQVEVQSLGLTNWFAPRKLEGAAREAIIDQRITILFRNPTEYPKRENGEWKRTYRIDQAGLGDLDFAKAVDPYTAFQEIAMWKGGVLPSDGPATVEITDDKVKIAKHGFHHPTSFRRPKADAR